MNTLYLFALFIENSANRYLGGEWFEGGRERRPQYRRNRARRPTTAAAFKAWCRAEMRALNDSDDVTLVDFLLSLPSAGEVQEYVQLYLGDTERAKSFGAELIRIKRTSPGIVGGGAGGGGDFADPGGGGGEGEWEGAGKKKGKKKR